jgi:hypothetical protein
MKNKLLIAVSAFVAFIVATVAFAQVNPRTLGDIFDRKAVVISKGTANSDPRAGALHIGRLNKEFPSTTHRITRMLRASYTIDFAATAVTCADSATQTLSGARTGDICIVTPPAAATALYQYQCRVSATDTVIVRQCGLTAAGDPASAAFDVMVLSNAAP